MSENLRPGIDPSTIEYYKSPEEIYLALTETSGAELKSLLLEPFGGLDEIPRGIRQFLSDVLEHAFAEISEILSIPDKPLRDSELSKAMRILGSVPRKMELLLQGIFIDVRYRDREVQYSLDSLDSEDLDYLVNNHGLIHLVNDIRSGKRIFSQKDLSFDRSSLFSRLKDVEQAFDKIFREIIKK